jgi:hypothetical protein
MISQQMATAIRKREARYDTWRNGRTSVLTADIPRWAPTNAERSQLELFDFVTNPPERYFAYVTINPDGATMPGSGIVDVPTYATATYGLHRVKVGTWVGDSLNSSPVTLGAVYRSNFGDKRRSIRFVAINGHTYAGTYYQSAGDYCRLRKLSTPRKTMCLTGCGRIATNHVGTCLYHNPDGSERRL